jgi:FtsP/CotA-like multicopper oxidase with cupredoxin domain
MSIKEPEMLSRKEEQETISAPLTQYAIERPHYPSSRGDVPVTKGLFASFGMLLFFGIILIAFLSFGMGASLVRSGSAATTSTDSSMPGMTMNQSTKTANVSNATAQYGNQLAQYTTDPDGSKHFTLKAEQVMWEVTKGHRELAWAINGTVPGPMLRVNAGDKVHVTFANHFPAATAVHWHGLQVSTSADGVPGLGQPPIAPHQTYEYHFTVNDADVGTHWYHSHHNDMVQVPGGFYGAFIVDPRPGTPQATQVIKADVEYDAFVGMLGSYYVISGKSFPDTQVLNVKHGQTVHIRFYGVDANFIHPIHLHGHTMRIIAEDGHPLAAPLEKDTFQLAPGETYDVVFQAWAPAGSAYPLHCHILSHLMNPGQKEDEMGGMIVLVQYARE